MSGFNGSGTFNISGVGLPYVSGTTISSAVANQLNTDLAAGLSNCITKDGQQSVQANIPFNNYKITQIGTATAATDAASVTNIQNATGTFLSVTGTNTIVATATPAITGYVAGMTFRFVAAGTNVGPVTINVSGLGAKAITKEDSQPLEDGDINSGYLVSVTYDGTNFVLQSGIGGGSGLIEQETQTATSGQTVFTLAGITYTPGTNNLCVFVDGVKQYVGSSYTETNITTVTFSSGLHTGASVQFIVFSTVEINTMSSANVTYTPAGTGAVTTNVQAKLRETVSVKDFGAVGDGVTDDTAAIQAAMNQGLATGRRVFFPSGYYKVTDTISLLNANYVKAFGFYGENANSTRIYFYNSTSLKNLFYVDSDVNYLEISDLEFLDNTARTSRAFYFFDNTSTAAPSWKHLFRNVRITQFKEGVRFDGGATIGSDTHESEVMFIHSKTRNCETGLIYNNIQAVNHQLIGFDMENDTEGVSDAWTHIKLERGTTINHLGGSVIGNGSYLKYAYTIAGGFQDTSQFASKGVRVEKRGTTTPLINQDTSSTITLSNSLRISIQDMAISADSGANVLACFGGRTFARFSNVHANIEMFVDAYMTSNLSSNTQYGGIVLDKCNAITYRRISNVAAYGGTAVGTSTYKAIPAEITSQNENTQFDVTGGYVVMNNYYQTIYSGNWQTATVKTLTYANTDSNGFGSGSDPYTDQVTLPLYGRPIKFKILRDAYTTGSPFVFTLAFVIGGVDYTVATITPGAGNYGLFEANLALPTAMVQAINDGVNWDGKMKITKSGSVTGFTGLIMIDYM